MPLCVCVCMWCWCWLAFEERFLCPLQLPALSLYLWSQIRTHAAGFWASNALATVWQRDEEKKTRNLSLKNCWSTMSPNAHTTKVKHVIHICVMRRKRYAMKMCELCESQIEFYIYRGQRVFIHINQTDSIKRVCEQRHRDGTCIKVIAWCRY